jgi:hypothetical protein
MPRFHFNVHDSTGFTPDEEGRELEGIEIVRREAIKGIRSVISQDALKGIVDLCGWMDVLDGAGGLVLRFDFSEAVDLRIHGDGEIHDRHS